MMHTEAERRALLSAQPARQQRRHQGRELRYEGTRMECAQCHDHPFDKWTQKQFFEMAAFSLTRAADRDGNWHFPTAALAVIDFPVDDWDDIEVGSGELWQFVRPRDLGVPGED